MSFATSVNSPRTDAQDADSQRIDEPDNVLSMPDNDRIRFATFNVSLFDKSAGQIRKRLSSHDDQHAKQIASVVQTIRPDVLLINELDHEPDSGPARLLAENYFAVAQESVAENEKMQPIDYPYVFSAASNTGLDSQLDLNRDGRLRTANDAWGYGVYLGQYAMAVYSRYPIDLESIRTFQTLLWKDMPGALRPIDPKSNQPYYADGTWAALRLSSKNHIDVPIRIGNQVIHVLASHPTPPVFDGPEDRNGARNHDEIEFWNHYLNHDAGAMHWLVDDRGRAGGLAADASFVILGDLNSDPIDGDGRQTAIIQLLSHPRTNDVQPKCIESDAIERLAKHRGKADIRTKTADFGRNGFMRVDFVIPSHELTVVDSGVFWPAPTNPLSRWTQATDHRMVWIDVAR